MLGRLCQDKRFVLKLPHIFSHRVLAHAHRPADSFVAGPAFVRLPVLTVHEVGVDRKLTRRQS